MGEPGEQDEYGIDQLMDMISDIDCDNFHNDIDTYSEKNNQSRCSECNKDYISSETQLECPECHKIINIHKMTKDENLKDIYSGRMKVVGHNASKYQSSMDKSTATKTPNQMVYMIYTKLLCKLNEKHQHRGYKPIEPNILYTTATIYVEIQQATAHHRISKRKILAALIKNECILNNAIRTDQEILTFMHLNTKGISEGDMYIKKIHEDGLVDITIDEIKIVPYVITIFNQLEVSKELNIEDAIHVELYQHAVIDIISKALKDHIGYKSVLRSKVITTVYVVLRRADFKIDITTVLTKCKIQLNTVNNFLKELKNHHEKFVEIYKKYGLNTTMAV
jgi:hypothetical protein